MNIIRIRRMFFLLVVVVLFISYHCVSYAGKPKILYVNSYHKGYQWSDDIEKGLIKALEVVKRADGTMDIPQSKVHLRIFRMNTKLNTSESFKRNAGIEAKSLIDHWQPDIVVTSDDNAAKYLIQPYFLNAQIPFVFCGLNWNAEIYGFPVSNVTGMVEVTPLLDTIKILKQYSKGDRIGYLGADDFTNRKILDHHQRVLGIQYADGQLVLRLDAWKAAFVRLQREVDLLIVLNPIAIVDWDARQAEDFVHAHTEIPTGCPADQTVRFVLLAKVKIAEEQGWWAGKTTLKILAGTSPADIPITMNRKSRVFINMRLSKRLGIKFPMDLIEKATLIEELPKRD